MSRKEKEKPYINYIIEEVKQAEIKERLLRDFKTNLLDLNRLNITNDKELDEMYYCDFRDPSDDGSIFAELATQRKGVLNPILGNKRIISHIHAIPKALFEVYVTDKGIVYETKLAGIPYMIYYRMFNLYYDKTNS